MHNLNSFLRQKCKTPHIIFHKYKSLMMKSSPIFFKKPFVLLLFILAFTSNSFSQNISVLSSYLPAEVVGCGDAATFQYRVFGPTAAGAEISVLLPSEAEYASLVSGAGVTVDNTNLQNPIFTLANALASSAGFGN